MTNRQRMRAALSEIHRAIAPAWDDEDRTTAEYQALSERDQVVAWYAYEVIFYAGLAYGKPVEEALDAAVLEFAKDGYHYPEHLEKYAYGQARAAFNKALRKGETDELIDGLESNLAALS